MKQLEEILTLAKEIERLASLSPMEYLKEINEVPEHDCHASPEDGCKGCALLGNVI